MLHCKLSLTMAIKTENDMVAVSTEQVISDNYCYLQFFRHTNYVCLEIFFLCISTLKRVVCGQCMKDRQNFYN